MTYRCFGGAVAPPQFADLPPVSAPILETALSRVLGERLRGFRSLRSCERLSGGASQETYRLILDTEEGERRLAMRRAPGGVKRQVPAPGPGLATEAKLFAAARAAGVPEPEILYVFGEHDGLGDGFLMEWLDGETLGAASCAAMSFKRSGRSSLGSAARCSRASTGSTSARPAWPRRCVFTLPRSTCARAGTSTRPTRRRNR